MRIVKVKRAMILFLIIGTLAVVAGCARWPEGPGPGPGETEYYLEITVEVDRVINTEEGIYYIVLDADIDYSTSADSGFFYWGDEFYYIKLEDGSFYFTKKEEGSSEISLTSSSIGEKKFQVTIALSDLGDPNSIDINVITTDTESSTIYDHLSSYFTINTNVLDSPVIKDDSPGDSGESGPDFDITEVSARIITLY